MNCIDVMGAIVCICAVVAAGLYVLTYQTARPRLFKRGGRWHCTSERGPFGLGSAAPVHVAVSAPSAYAKWFADQSERRQDKILDRILDDVDQSKAGWKMYGNQCSIRYRTH